MKKKRRFRDALISIPIAEKLLAISNYLELFYVRIRIERRETRISYTSREYKCLSVRLVGKNGEESGVRARIYIATTGPLARERNMRRARRRAQVVEGRSEREGGKEYQRKRNRE